MHMHAHTHTYNVESGNRGRAQSSAHARVYADETPPTPPRATASQAARATVRELLSRAEACAGSASSSDWSRSQLEAYVRRLPAEVLDCVLDYINVDTPVADGAEGTDGVEGAVALGGEGVLRPRRDGEPLSAAKLQTLSGERMFADAAMCVHCRASSFFIILSCLPVCPPPGLPACHTAATYGLQLAFADAHATAMHCSCAP